MLFGRKLQLHRRQTVRTGSGPMLLALFSCQNVQNASHFVFDSVFVTFSLRTLEKWRWERASGLVEDRHSEARESWVFQFSVLSRRLLLPLIHQLSFSRSQAQSHPPCRWRWSSWWWSGRRCNSRRRSFRFVSSRGSCQAFFYLNEGA